MMNKKQVSLGYAIKRTGKQNKKQKWKNKRFRLSWVKDDFNFKEEYRSGNSAQKHKIDLCKDVKVKDILLEMRRGKKWKVF